MFIEVRMSLAGGRYLESTELYFLAKVRSSLHSKIIAVRQAQQFIKIVTQQRYERQLRTKESLSSDIMSQSHTSQSRGKVRQCYSYSPELTLTGTMLCFIEFKIKITTCINISA